MNAPSEDAPDQQPQPAPGASGAGLDAVAAPPPAGSQRMQVERVQREDGRMLLLFSWHGAK